MELIVYSSAWCPDCREAKRFLAKHNIPYQEIDVATTPGAIEEIVKRTAIGCSLMTPARASSMTKWRGVWE
jgi:glutaredoxin